MAQKHYEKIVINNGGTVGKCWECKKTGGLRFVTETRNLCPDTPHSWKDVQNYRLCDNCADREKLIFTNDGAEVIDGRQLQSEFNRI